MADIDIIMLINSDSHGDPETNGPDGHFVWMSDGLLIAVNQMHQGGRFPDADCADACQRGIALKYGLDVSVLRLEQLDATTSKGTWVANVAQGLNDIGIPATAVEGHPPPGLSVMNPAWGGIYRGGLTSIYYAASQGWMIVIDSAQLASSTSSTGGGTPEQEVDMLDGNDPQVQQLNSKLDALAKGVGDVRAALSAEDLVIVLKAPTVVQVAPGPVPTTGEALPGPTVVRHSFTLAVPTTGEALPGPTVVRHSFTLAGADEKTEWNIQAQGDDGSSAVVHAFATPFGAQVPAGSANYTTVANHAGVAGPVQAPGSAASLGITGPCQVEFVNDGPADVEITLHP